MGRPSYSTVVRTAPESSSEALVKKLDNIWAKVEEESSATRRSLEELKEEMRTRYEESRQHVEVLEKKIMNMEKKSEVFASQICAIMQNVCTSILDPPGTQGASWKSYWQEQINSLQARRQAHAIPAQ